jgi:hypothetical protein
MWRRKRSNHFGDPMESRLAAEEHFHIDRVSDRLARVLESVILRGKVAQVYESKATLQRSRSSP